MSSRHRRDPLVWVVVAVVAVVVLLPLVTVLFAMPMMGMMGMGGGGGPGTGTGSFWGIVSMLLVLAVLIGVGYALYRALLDSGGGDVDPAVEELRMAYARGDLSDDEFEERRARLGGDRD